MNVFVFADDRDRMAYVETTMRGVNNLASQILQPVMREAKACALYQPSQHGYTQVKLLKPDLDYPDYFPVHIYEFERFGIMKAVPIYGRLRAKNSTVSDENRIIFHLGYKAVNDFMLPDFNYLSRYELHRGCEVCENARGGVPGNENIINGHVVCDYCHADGSYKKL